MTTLQERLAELEAVRREPNGSLRMVPLPGWGPDKDWGHAGSKIDRASQTLNEALPNGQKRRIELAMRLLLEGVEELRDWLRAAGADV